MGCRADDDDDDDDDDDYDDDDDNGYANAPLLFFTYNASIFDVRIFQNMEMQYMGNKFLMNKTNRCTEFQFYWYYQ